MVVRWAVRKTVSLSVKVAVAVAALPKLAATSCDGCGDVPVSHALASRPGTDQRQHRPLRQSAWQLASSSLLLCAMCEQSGKRNHSETEVKTKIPKRTITGPQSNSY